MTTTAQGASPATLTGVLPTSLKLGWAMGSMGVSMLLNGVSILILFYLIGVMKIEPALAGAIIFVSKLFDVATDPVVGVWSDRIESSRGRRRPFLFWGGILCAISFALIFAGPQFGSKTLTAAYALATLCLYAFAYTLYNIPYLSMPAEMTDDYHERSSIHAYRIVFVALGSFLAASVAPALIERLGKGDPATYRLVGFVIAAVMLVTMLGAYFTTARAKFTNRTVGRFDWRGELSAISGNKHFVRLIAVKFAQLTAFQSMQAAFLFFIAQRLELGFGILVYYGSTLTVMMIVAAPLLVRFSRAFGKRNAYLVAASAYVLVALSWSLAGPGEPVWAICARAALTGIAASGNVVLAMSMLTDVINQDARRTGVRREGAFTSVYSFVEKFTAALAPLIIGLALSLANFDPSLPPQQVQGGDVPTALLFAVSWLPAGMALVALLILKGYQLGEADLSGPVVALPVGAQ